VSTETIGLLLPEAVLILAATAIYLAGAFVPARRGWSLAGAAGLLLAAFALYLQGHGQVAASGQTQGAATLSGPLVVDALSDAARWFVLAVGLVLMMITARSLHGKQAAETVGSLLLMFAGLMLVSVAADLVLLFVALELISIPIYIVLYLGRQDAANQESAIKYFFLSILSSALLLYGFSFLYGATGSTGLEQIQRVLAGTSESAAILLIARLALLLIVAGLGFRITVVPFHFYAPDVYEGTSHLNAALLAIVPKIAGLVALLRIAGTAMPGLEQLAWQVLLILALVTMTVGNVVALWQNNVRRLMAYSSIAHAGYMLIGLAVGFATVTPDPRLRSLDGMGATLFYLAVYAMATAGVFAALVYLSGERRQIDTVDDLAGLSRTHPFMAAAIAIFMFSLTGLPPLAGFWGKLMLFTGALAVDPNGFQIGGPLAKWFLALAVIGVLNAAISAAYYLRIVAVMYFRPSLTAPRAEGGVGAALATLVCAVLVVAAGLYPGPLVEQASVASRSAQGALSHGHRAARVAGRAVVAEVHKPGPIHRAP